MNKKEAVKKLNNIWPSICSPEWQDRYKEIKWLLFEVIESNHKDLGKLGGKVKSEAKTKAARLNGKKGGRPKKNPSLLT